MSDEPLRYDKMVESALRGVVRQALGEVGKRGLPGQHHFYITFFTNFPGVSMAEHLRARYPVEMTIVLQYQFDDLRVEEEGFSVRLSFNNTPELLVIPYAAVTTFADPSVNFALQFQPMVGDDTEEEEPEAPRRPALKAVGPDDEDFTPPEAAPRPQSPVRPVEQARDEGKDDGDGDGEPRGQVVTLDAFRKK